MKTLTISISDKEYAKFGPKDEKLTHYELLDLVGKELAWQNLDQCVELAEKYGLSTMTMEDIPKEVRA